MTDEFKYDVFLNHCQEDKTRAMEIADRYKANGLKVWLPELALGHSDNILAKIEEGLRQSRTLVLCVSKQAISSNWAALESSTYQFRDSNNKGRRFIPVKLDDTPLPKSLEKYAYIDLRANSAEEYIRLLTASRPVQTEVSPQVEDQNLVSFKVLEVLFVHPSCIAISQDGRYAFSGNLLGKVRRWDLETGKCIGDMGDSCHPIDGLSVSIKGKIAVSGRYDGALVVWSFADPSASGVLPTNSGYIRATALTPDGKRAVSGSSEGMVCIWDLPKRKLIAALDGHTNTVTGVGISADGSRVISGSWDTELHVWNLGQGKTFLALRGHTEPVTAVSITADGKRAVSGSEDRTIRVWDLDAGRLVATLEGHTASIKCLAISSNGEIAVSCSDGNVILVWDLGEFKEIGVLEGHSSKLAALAISGDGARVVSTSEEGEVRLWTLPKIQRITEVSVRTSVYTNAKILLVGESGVGKTGLAYRLTQDTFRESISTDAAWATQLKLPNTFGQSGIEREIWMWDFAGQADYRLIHQLYMDETALAVLVFNPQSENPFEGLGQWDRDLHRAARRSFKKILVAGRCDRGGLMVSRATIDQFREDRDFAEYIETSALRGTGCSELRNAIVRHIPWDAIPWTASPRIFKLLKDEIVKLKDEGKVLLRISELKQQLELRLPQENFALEQLRAVVGLLASPGVVWQLEFGDFVLLQPERINSYAAAVIRSVRAHAEEIGCITEGSVLSGELDFQDLKRLQNDEEQIVLRAMHQTFVDHGLCLREHTEKGTLLIFPSYFKRERPAIQGHPLVLVTYQFNGPLDEIYATLVVKLFHTAAFEKDRLWRFAADFKTQANKRLGLKMIKRAEGSAELEVYCDSGIPNEVQVTFIRYIHEHLKLKAHDVVRLRHYVCPKCGVTIENRRAIEMRLEKGYKDIVCSVCEGRVELWDLIEDKFASEEVRRKARGLDEFAKANIDNESRELILIGHVYAISGEAGQIYRQYTNSDHGIDGEIEFKTLEGLASGKRLYLQLKSGDSYLVKRKKDGAEVFSIKKKRWAEYWQEQAYPVMLVIRTSDGLIRWMDVTDYLKRKQEKKKPVTQIVFTGQPLTALNVLNFRDRLFSPPN